MLSAIELILKTATGLLCFLFVREKYQKTVQLERAFARSLLIQPEKISVIPYMFFCFWLDVCGALIWSLIFSCL